LNDPRFGSRMKEEGIFADMIADVFKLALSESREIQGRSLQPSTAAFRQPGGENGSCFE